MNCIHLNHIAINTVDLEQSIHFYGKLLKLEALGQIDMTDHLLTYYRLDNDCRLELITYQAPISPIRYPAEMTGIYRHFALDVDDVKAYEQYLSQNGVTIIQASQHSDKLKAVCMLIRDPNGVEIELVQRDLRPSTSENAPGR